MTILNQTTAPADLLITLADAKTNLAIEHADDDDRITKLIQAAQEIIEDEADASILSQQWALQSCDFPTMLTKPPVTTIDSVTYYDSDNNSQTLAPSEYYLLSSRYEASVVYNSTRPALYARPDAVTVTYTAGYSAAPERAKQACRALVDLLNENRGDGEFKIPTAVMRLIRSLKHGGYQ